MATAPLLLAQDPIRSSEAEARKAAITKVNPEYPAMARQMHVAGTVVVEAEVDTEGNVDRIQPVKGNALLNSAVTAAVKKWKFSSALTGGKRARAVVRLEFNFIL